VENGMGVWACALSDALSYTRYNHFSDVLTYVSPALTLLLLCFSIFKDFFAHRIQEREEGDFLCDVTHYASNVLRTKPPSLQLRLHPSACAAWCSCWRSRARRWRCSRSKSWSGFPLSLSVAAISQPFSHRESRLCNFKNWWRLGCMRKHFQSLYFDFGERAKLQQHKGVEKKQERKSTLFFFLSLSNSLSSSSRFCRSMAWPWTQVVLPCFMLLGGTHTHARKAKKFQTFFFSDKWDLVFLLLFYLHLH